MGYVKPGNVRSVKIDYVSGMKPNDIRSVKPDNLSSVKPDIDNVKM